MWDHKFCLYCGAVSLIQGFVKRGSNAKGTVKFTQTRSYCVDRTLYATVYIARNTHFNIS